MLIRDYINYYSQNDTSISDIANMSSTIALFDAYSANSLTLSSNKVARWDSLKNGYYFEQSDSAKQPAYDASNKVINFDTTAKVLSSTNLAGITNNIGKITVIGVCTYPDTTGWHLWLYLSTGGTTASRIAMGQAQIGTASIVNKQFLGRRLDAGTTATINSGVAGTAKSIQTISLDYNTNTGKFYVDGVQKANVSNVFASGTGNTSSTNSNFVLLGQNSSGNYPLSGHLFGVVFGNYSDAERILVEKFIAKRYGIIYAG